MSEGGSLGKAGRAARVLDVDRVVEVEVQAPGSNSVGVGGRAGQRLPLVGAEKDRPFETREVGADAVDHGDKVGTLELLRGEEPAAARLTKRVLELVRPVG